jgi:hypothetical protein
MAKIFGFPNPVNETSARIVAGGAVVMSVAFVITGNPWLLLPLTYGFIARVCTGPFLSPLGRISTQIITPRIKREHRLVPGPPKRFAQGIGALFSVAGSVLWFADAQTASRVVIAMLAAAASLEAFVGFCLGCAIFARLMRWGVSPEAVCAECNDISQRIQSSSPA